MPNWLTSAESRLNTNLNPGPRTGRSGRVLSGRLHALGCPGCLGTPPHFARDPIPLRSQLHPQPIYRAMTNLRLVIAVSSKIKPAKNPQLHKHKKLQTQTSVPHPSPNLWTYSLILIQLQTPLQLQKILIRPPIFRLKWRYPAICVFGFLQALEPWHCPALFNLDPYTVKKCLQNNQNVLGTWIIFKDFFGYK